MKTWILTLFITLALSLLVFVRGEAQEHFESWDEEISLDESLALPSSIPFEGLEPTLIREIKLKDGTILKAQELPNSKVILRPVAKDSHNGGGG